MDKIPQMTDLSTTGLCQISRSRGLSQRAAKDGADGFFKRKMPLLGRALNFLAVTPLVAYFGHARKEVS